MGVKKLSILICTLPTREKSLEELLEVLDKQMTPEVEILANDIVECTVGQKRNLLMEDAIGDYICWADR